MDLDTLDLEFKKIGYKMNIEFTEAHNVTFKLFKDGHATASISYDGDSLEAILAALVVKGIKPVEIEDRLSIL